MALPQIVLPSALPAFLAEGHDVELDPAYAHVPMRTGHARLRRIYTTAHRLQAVSLVLSPVQMQAFHEWFEDALQAGALPFAAEVKNQGAATVWWKAYFAGGDEGVYEAEHIGPHWWRVRAQLLLTEGPYPIGPLGSTMRAEISVPLSGAATLTTQILLGAEISVPLLGFVVDPALAAEIDVPLGGSVSDVLLAAEIVVELEGAA